MKVYPLIYSRTKFVDYISGFLTRPSDINYKKAMVYVNKALEDVKYSDGIRHAVFAIDDYLIYGGTACVSDDIVSRILIEKNIQDLDYDYKDYLNDSANRPITFFIGFAIKRESIEVGKIPNIDLYQTYKIYLDLLKKKWNDSVVDTEIPLHIELDEVRYIEKFIPDIMECNGINILKNYEEKYYKNIMNYYFCEMIRHNNQDNSFLSGVLVENFEENMPFKNVSLHNCRAEELPSKVYTSLNNNIYTYQRNEEIIGKSKSDDFPKITTVDDIEKTKNYNSNLEMPYSSEKYKKKRSNLIIGVLVGIFLVCIFLAIL